MTVIPTSRSSGWISACSGVSSDSIFLLGNSSLFAIRASAARWVLKDFACRIANNRRRFAVFSLNALHKAELCAFTTGQTLAQTVSWHLFVLLPSPHGTDRYGPLYVRRFAARSRLRLHHRLMAELLHLRQALGPSRRCCSIALDFFRHPHWILPVVPITSYFSDSSIAANIENADPPVLLIFLRIVSRWIPGAGNPSLPGALPQRESRVCSITLLEVAHHLGADHFSLRRFLPRSAEYVRAGSLHAAPVSFIQPLFDWRSRSKSFFRRSRRPSISHTSSDCGGNMGIDRRLKTSS